MSISESYELLKSGDYHRNLILNHLLAAEKCYEMHFESPFLIFILKENDIQSLSHLSTFLQTSQKADINFIQRYSKPQNLHFLRRGVSQLRSFNIFSVSNLFAWVQLWFFFFFCLFKHVAIGSTIIAAEKFA